MNPLRTRLLQWLPLLTACAIIAIPAQGARRIARVNAPSPVADQVFHSLTATPICKAIPSIQWGLGTFPTLYVNAYSVPSGSLYVTDGITQLLNTDRGVWAAVLSHEIGHVLIHNVYSAYFPQIEAELVKAYTEAVGVDNAQKESRALAVTAESGGLTNLKGLREKEYEADRLGLMIMAEAGYHPDYAIAMERFMRAFLGDQPRGSEFLLSHPRWESREQRMMDSHKIALAIFNSRWPDAAKSPGGNPPPLGTIGTVKLDQASEPGTLIIHVPVKVTHGEVNELRLGAQFVEARRVLTTDLPEFRSTDGSLVLNQYLPHDAKIDSEFTLKVPTSALAASRPKLTLSVFIASGPRVIATSFVHFMLPAK
jgi:hypothetical protein